MLRIQNRPPQGGARSAAKDISVETLATYQMFRMDPQAHAVRAFPEATGIRADSIMVGDRTIPIVEITGRTSVDATIILDRTALAAMQAQVIKKEYPRLRMANGEIIPIDRSNENVTITGDGLEIVEILQTDEIGSMAAISDYTNGGPPVDVLLERMFVFVKYIGAQANYSMFEIRNTANSKTPLKPWKLNALREAFLKYIDNGGYFGDPSIGLQGLLTINGTNEYTSPAPITTAMTADVMAAILADIASSIGQTTNGIEMPDTIITTLRVRDAAMHTRRALGGKSVYEEFMETEAAAGRITRWVVDEHLKGAAPSGGDLALVLAYDIFKVKLKIVQDFTMLDEQQRGYGYTVHAFASTALVICYAPQSIMKCYGM